MTEAKFLTPAELVERWAGAVTLGTLANWRSRCKPGRQVGPAFQKIGSRVLYPLAAVMAYESANLVGAMNDNKAADSAA